MEAEVEAEVGKRIFFGMELLHLDPFTFVTSLAISKSVHNGSRSACEWRPRQFFVK